MDYNKCTREKGNVVENAHSLVKRTHAREDATYSSGEEISSF